MTLENMDKDLGFLKKRAYSFLKSWQRMIDRFDLVIFMGGGDYLPLGTRLPQVGK